MRVRIIIDTDDADSPEAIETGTPFTLNVYCDDDDGTPSREPLEVGSESCLIGGDISAMLRDLATSWQDGRVFGQDGTALPCGHPGRQDG